eukprot:s3530_g7.t1
MYGGKATGPPPPKPVNEPGPGDIRARRDDQPRLAVASASGPRPLPGARSRSPCARRSYQDVRPAASGSAGSRDRSTPTELTGEEDVVDAAGDDDEDAASDGRWSETSHTLEGKALEDARN